ncbi:MAG: hypothetical protein ACRESU_11350 [Gammaproteobacteria bacterium]
MAIDRHGDTVIRIEVTREWLVYQQVSLGVIDLNVASTNHPDMIRLLVYRQRLNVRQACQFQSRCTIDWRHLKYALIRRDPYHTGIVVGIGGEGEQWKQTQGKHDARNARQTT